VKPVVLVVEDDPKFARLVQHMLFGEGFEVTFADKGSAALDWLRSNRASAVVLDLGLPDMSGKEALRRIRAEHPSLPVIIATADEGIESVVECMSAGAIDYVPKAIDPQRLITAVRNACERGVLESRLASVSQEFRRRHGFETMIGESPALVAAKRLLDKAAGSEVTVLLEGESGTGKEVAARAIHAESARCAGPFVALNCGAIPETLIESELFGHDRGAFTGAVAERTGVFERADRGTLFLDEVGELRVDLQVRLLRALQERCIQRVGGNREIHVDVRVIAATNRDLRADAAAGRFREDLYYRLAVFPCRLPPLREREGDVRVLTHAFVERFSARHHRPVVRVSDDAMRVLEAYAWPGNVRQLANVIERAVILEESDTLSMAALDDELLEGVEPATWLAPPLPGTTGTSAEEHDGNGAGVIEPLEQVEKRLICRALEVTQWNVQVAAKRLGIGRATLYRRMDRLGLTRESRGR